MPRGGYCAFGRSRLPALLRFQRHDRIELCRPASVVLGVAGALALGRVLSNVLRGVSATDPLAFVSMVALLIVVSALATLLPTVRASRLQPALVLRKE